MPLVRFVPLCWVLFPSENRVLFDAASIVPGAGTQTQAICISCDTGVWGGVWLPRFPVTGKGRLMPSPGSFPRLPGLSWFLPANSLRAK